MMHMEQKMGKRPKVIFILVALIFASVCIIPPQIAYAQGSLGLPEPGAIVSLSPGFTPTVLRGIRVYPDNPLKFDFIVDAGDSGLGGEALRTESEKLVRYFLTSLAIPEDDLWVNLSPYEKDRITPDALSATEMGRDMLAQDYLLKQITASLIHPEQNLGKQFWDRVYKQMFERYGIVNAPINTFNKVWIVPQDAAIYEAGGKAFVVESRLSVMLEQDYLALNNNIQNITAETPRDAKDISAISSEVVREILIPELEKEVNEGKNFAQLRQIYNSLILATWYKINLKNTILNTVYSDHQKVQGIDLAEPGSKEIIYQEYINAFKKGVCNMMRIEFDPRVKKSIPRKYFSGGMLLKFNLSKSGSSALRTLQEFPANFLNNLKKRSILFSLSVAMSLIGLQVSAQQTDLAYTDVPGVSAGLTDRSEKEIAPEQKYSDNIFTLFSEIAQSDVDSFKAILGSEEIPSDNEKKWAKNTQILEEAYNYLLQGQNGALSFGSRQVPDIAPISKIKKILTKLDSTIDDPRVAKVHEFVDQMNRVHILGEFDGDKPTFLFIHGADRGMFDTFNQVFEKIKNDYNIAYYLYDNYGSLDKASERLYAEIKRIETGYGVSLNNVITYSMGGIVWRHFMQTYPNEHCGQFIEIAAPLAGASDAAWVSASVPKTVLKISNKLVFEMASILNPFGPAMQSLFNQETLNSLKARTTHHTMIIAENDPHAPRKNFVLEEIEGIDFAGYKQRYSDALAQGEVILMNNPAIALDPHTNITNEAESVSRIVSAIKNDVSATDQNPSDGKSSSQNNEPEGSPEETKQASAAEINPGGIDFNASRLSIKTNKTEEAGPSTAFHEPFNVDPMQILGCQPITINFTPISDLTTLLNNK